LSGAGSGKLVPVVAIASPGTLVHQAEAGVQDYDEVYIFATNRTGADAKLTVEWGGLTVGDHLCEETVIPPRSLPILVAWGHRLNNALEVRAFSDIANAINLSGWSSKISA
jgi:hypothetical protein